jgi:hypothetical protein
MWWYRNIQNTADNEEAMWNPGGATFQSEGTANTKKQISK